MSATADGVPVAGDVIAEKYRVESVLGRGGMGTVLDAVHLFTGKNVAIKWMLPSLSREPEACARFLREAQIAGKLEHSSIVSVHDVGQERGSMYLVMERLHGETLADLLERGPIASGDAIRILMPVLRAISAAHEVGIIHRDLKPENIFLCHDTAGRALDPKVLDFGISKLVDGTESLKLTRTGTVVGTMFYMAPEQIAAGEVDARADVFSLAVILYQCLTGSMPFEAPSFNALVVAMATRDPIPLRDRDPSIDPALDAIVLRALSRDPEMRTPDVASFARSLESFSPGVRFELPREGWRVVQPQLPATAEPRTALDPPSAPPRSLETAFTPATTHASTFDTAAGPPIRSRSAVIAAVAGLATAAIALVIVVGFVLVGESSSTLRSPTPLVPARAPRATNPLARPLVVVPTPADLVPPVAPRAEDGAARIADAPQSVGTAAVAPQPASAPTDESRPTLGPTSRRARRSGERPPGVRGSRRTPRIRVEDF